VAHLFKPILPIDRGALIVRLALIVRRVAEELSEEDMALVGAVL
jgi:hypothetical protein